MGLLPDRLIAPFMISPPVRLPRGQVLQVAIMAAGVLERVHPSWLHFQQGANGRAQGWSNPDWFTPGMPRHGRHREASYSTIAPTIISDMFVRT